MYKEVKKKLLDMKRQIIEGINQQIDIEKDDSKQEIGDSYDYASNDRERELNLLLVNREQEKLDEIEDALTRIEEKTYGVCEDCGEKIPPKRLLALPFTRLCVRCKDETEKMDKIMKRTEESRGIRRIPLPDSEDDEY